MKINDIKSMTTTLLFVAAISINMATGADLPVSSDVKMLGEEEQGGIVFQIGKSQVCIKIDGNVTAEIDHQNNSLILREGDPTKDEQIQYQSDSQRVQQHEFTHEYVDAQLRKMKQK